jgi:hypothetical protein
MIRCDDREWGFLLLGSGQAFLIASLFSAALFSISAVQAGTYKDITKEKPQTQTNTTDQDKAVCLTGPGGLYYNTWIGSDHFTRDETLAACDRAFGVAK